MRTMPRVKDAIDTSRLITLFADYRRRESRPHGFRLSLGRRADSVIGAESPAERWRDDRARRGGYACRIDTMILTPRRISSRDSRPAFIDAQPASLLITPGHKTRKARNDEGELFVSESSRRLYRDADDASIINTCHHAGEPMPMLHIATGLMMPVAAEVFLRDSCHYLARSSLSILMRSGLIY